MFLFAWYFFINNLYLFTYVFGLFIIYLCLPICVRVCTVYYLSQFTVQYIFVRKCLIFFQLPYYSAACVLNSSIHKIYLYPCVFFSSIDIIYIYILQYSIFQCLIYLYLHYPWCSVSYLYLLKLNICFTVCQLSLCTASLCLPVPYLFLNLYYLSVALILILLFLCLFLIYS